MPLIEISHAPKSADVDNEAIIAAVTAAYAEAAGVPADKVWVLLQQYERDAWGSGGKTLAAGDAK